MRVFIHNLNIYFCVLVGPLPTLEPLSFIDKTSLVFTLCLIAHSFVIVLDTWRSWSTEVQIDCINCFKIIYFNLCRTA